MAEAARNTNIGIAGQNLAWAREGAFTGEISAPMLAEAGAGYVIIGHSERRQLFGETDERVHEKVRAAFDAKLTPIVCVGETLQQRETDQTLDVLDRQVKQGLEGVTVEELAGLILAYEPVWAIGTGRNATPAQAGEVHAHIRGRLREWFSEDAAAQVRIIYGGSVKPGNIADLAAEPELDGALVGGASLEIQSFMDIVAGSRPPAV